MRVCVYVYYIEVFNSIDRANRLINENTPVAVRIKPGNAFKDDVCADTNHGNKCVFDLYSGLDLGSEPTRKRRHERDL